MKVYSCPKEVPVPTPDYANYNREKEEAAEAKHMADLKDFLKKNGCPGKYTGEIYKEGVADGYALYMVADGPKSFLIHLPYGDGYQARDVSFLPKKEVISRIDRDKAFSAMWRKKPVRPMSPHGQRSEDFS